MLASVIVVSDTAAADNSTDKASAALQRSLSNTQFIHNDTQYVKDDVAEIQQAVKNAPASIQGGILICTGGTGFSYRDVTPEAIEPMLERKAPGIVHTMFAKSMEITKFACMARTTAGVYNKAMVLVLPGKPKAAVENLESVIDVLPHAVNLIAGDDSRRLHEKMARHGTVENEQSRGSSSNNNNNGHSHGHNHGHKHGHSHSHSHSHHGHGAHSGPKFHKLVDHLSNKLDAPVSKRARTSPYPMTPVPDAEKIVLNNTPVPTIVSIDILDPEFIGCIVAEDVKSQVNVPSFRASIVDGYAVKHSNGPGEYSLSAISHASPSQVAKLQENTIARITTGAPVPNGATAIIPVEETAIVKVDAEGDEEIVSILAQDVKEGDNIREIGSDVANGTIILSKGTKVGSNGGVVGLLSSVGVKTVQVYKKPVVGVMSTGDELVDAAEHRALSGGEIWDSNRPSLLSMVRSWGCKAVDLGICNDNAENLKSQLSNAAVDIVITSGGVSMGEMDLLKPTIEQSLNGTIQFGRVAMKPGKPTTFATLPDNKLIFALPGNPASATVTFHLFVLLSIRKLQGYTNAHLPRVKVTLPSDYKLDPRPEFHRVNITEDSNGNKTIESTGGQRSSRIGSLAGANALLRLPTGTEPLKKGSQVEATIIEPIVYV